MDIFKKIDEMRNFVRSEKKKGKTVGFVPTLGTLHKGHETLIERSIKECDCTVVSIFLNPVQFDRKDDLKKYPVCHKEDLSVCEMLGVDAVFDPSQKEMYGGGSLVMVSIAILGDRLCGMSRPGHFRGVMLVVAKLFNIVGPDVAYFGEKDIQQLIIIKQLVQDLSFPIKIVPVKTVREKDGLALSSRNKRLSKEERGSALKLHCALMKIQDNIRRMEGESQDEGMRVSDILAQSADDLVSDPLIELDYLAAVDEQTLQDVEKIRKGTIFAIAAFVGKTRLIDNWTYR